MLPKVREHIDERVSHLSRGRERSPVPAIRPKAPAAKNEPIDRARDAVGNAANAGGQGSLVARLDVFVNGGART
jgi:hypothetical protein